MATSTVTPPASAPAAAPSTPSPASAPSSSTPSTPAPATPVSTTVETPSAEPKSMADKLAEGWTAAKAAVEADQTAEEVPVVEPAAVVPATEEEITATPVVEPEKTEEEKTAAAATEEVPELDDGQSLAPQDFFKELNSDPAAKKFFDDHPEIKNKVGAALRRDSENREIRQYVPTVEAAREISGAAATFQQVDNLFLKATTAEGADAFVTTWAKQALITGPDGKPLMDEHGKYQVHPALPYVLDRIAGNKLGMWAQSVAETGKLPAQLAPLVDAIKSFAVTKGDERLQAVAEILKEAMSTPSSSALGEVPDELKPFASSLKAEREALDNEKATAARQQQERQDALHQQSIERAETKAIDAIRAQLKPSFDRAGLTDFEADAARREIGDLIDQKLGDDSLYQHIYDSILIEPPSESREKKLTKHMLTYTQEKLGPIVADVLRKAKAGTLKRQTDRQDKVDTQKKASSSDPRGTSITAPSTQPLTTNAAIIAEYKAANNGEAPTQEYVLGEALKRVRTQRA